MHVVPCITCSLPPLAFPQGAGAPAPCFSSHLNVSASDCTVSLSSLTQSATSAGCFHWNLFLDYLDYREAGLLKSWYNRSLGIGAGREWGEGVRKSINMCQETRVSMAENLSHRKKFFHFTVQSLKLVFFSSSESDFLHPSCTEL